MKPRNLALTLCLLACAAQVQAASLVNINTADSATLQTLSGIGPAKAQAIIDYRTQNGLFQTIEDIMQVSGIGTATYDGIKAFITVSDSGVSQTQSQTQSTSSPVAQTQTQTQTVGGAGPPLITAHITTDVAAVAGAGTVFDGTAFGAQGQPLAGARFVWNFGDGGTAEGARVVHTFAYPGTYDVQLAVAYNYSSATARLALDAAAAQVSLVAEGDGSLTLYNYSNGDLDIGWWSLRQGSSTPFVIPEGTAVLAGKGVRFAPMVLRFNGDERAALYYPNGALASSAAVGAQSPLRGQTVEMSAETQKLMAGGGLRSDGNATSVDLPAGKSTYPEAAVFGSNAAAAGAIPAPLVDEIEWSYLLGLMTVIAIGAVGSYYAYTPRPSPETSDIADEFDIE